MFKKIYFTLTTIFLVLFVLETGTFFLNLGFSETDNKHHSFYQKSVNYFKTNSFLKRQIHPYFGFIYPQDSYYTDAISGTLIKRKVNNYGFLSELNYPYFKKKDELTIAILGGSVAEGFAAYFEKSPFLVEIEEIVGKKIKILNLSLGSGQQPQQFFISSYFIESIDLFINLDGFNEVTGVKYNKAPIEYPSMDFSSIFLNKEMNLSILKTMYIADYLYRINLFLSDSFLANSNTLFFTLRNIMKLFIQHKLELHEKLDDLNFDVKVKFYDKDNFSADKILSLHAKNWSKYTLLQHQLFSAQNKKALFFLQPSLWIADSKEFTSTEKKYKKVLYSNITSPISKSYEALRLEMARMEQSHDLTVHDLTYLFKDTQETIYVDNCCHLNNEGNRIMADKVTSEIIKTLKSRTL